MEQSATLDSLMADFVCDMAVADDELSDSIFTCVDNFIDDLCVQVMQDENSPFETDPSEGDLPFNYIIDKVLERIDTIEDISNDSFAQAVSDRLKGDGEFNAMDPDYCEDIVFDEITPEDFQLYIPTADRGEDGEDQVPWSTDNGTNVNSAYDSIFNA